MKIATADKWFSLLYASEIAKTEYAIVVLAENGLLENMDAGHFVNRQFKALRFNEKNVNAQCRHCNRFCEGNGAEYSLFMIKNTGLERWKN